MLAYFGDPEIKAFYLERVTEHERQDEILQHFGYWRDGRGCAVGCTLHSGDHGAYERELGIPAVLAQLEDAIFENLPVEGCQSWPRQFLQAPAVGADLSVVWPRFALFLLEDSEFGLLAMPNLGTKTRTIVEQAANLYRRWVATDIRPAREMRMLDDVAVEAAQTAVRSEDEAAAQAVCYSAEGHAMGVLSEAGRCHAISAETSFTERHCARKAYREATEQHFVASADKLLALMHAAPVVATANI
jgi:hypothetical protein